MGQAGASLRAGLPHFLWGSRLRHTERAASEYADEGKQAAYDDCNELEQEEVACRSCQKRVGVVILPHQNAEGGDHGPS